MAGYYTLGVEADKHNGKQPFPHQSKAFAALTKTLPTPIKGYAGTLLVLPTGAGKTYTSVKWICQNILSAGIKVVWLAQSSYLIDQAADEFKKEVYNAIGREKINLRVVSSSTSHSNAGTINLMDDVLICTIQTAISAYSAAPLDGSGEVTKTPFRNFIDNCKDTQLFVVIDEAHHTPAYGCRTLLLSLREEVKNLYILGLTATPMHMDKRISGWLEVIYDKGVCCEADKSVLQAEKILSVPKYIEKNTGMEFEVDDGLYDRLMNKHKDLTDNIIESLANNQGRNNFIVSEYLNNREEWGKTLIFADRWFQCEHILEKLKAQGIRANAVYSVVEGQSDYYRSGTGRRSNKENEEVLKDFKDGKYDVIVNVKMLTEGVDVPDVKTVMITRKTTSTVLLTQMIGRALRGEKAGGGEGKEYANIVMFHDNWKRVLPWAEIGDGDTETIKPPAQRCNPMQLVSIHLVKMAIADIEYKGFGNAGYLTFIPVGFYGCEYVVAVEVGSVEELITVEESIVVYEFNRNGYQKFIDYLAPLDLRSFAAENVLDSCLEESFPIKSQEIFSK